MVPSNCRPLLNSSAPKTAPGMWTPSLKSSTPQRHLSSYQWRTTSPWWAGGSEEPRSQGASKWSTPSHSLCAASVCDAVTLGWYSVMLGWLAIAGSLLLHNFHMPKSTRLPLLPSDQLIGLWCNQKWTKIDHTKKRLQSPASHLYCSAPKLTRSILLQFCYQT